MTINEPFKSQFNDSLAKDFYKNVRCAILHQADTSGNWIVKDGEDSDNIVVKGSLNITIRWRPLRKSFDAFLESYGEMLKLNQEIQKNFILKWNMIANI